MLTVAGSIAHSYLRPATPRNHSGYQTVQRFSGAIGAPALHENALANSGLSDTGPFTRHCAVE
jgi:hypothetical protein